MSFGNQSPWAYGMYYMVVHDLWYVCMFTSCHTRFICLLKLFQSKWYLWMLYDFEHTEICHRHQSHKSMIAAPPHMFFTILKSQSLEKGSVQPFPQAERSLHADQIPRYCKKLLPKSDEVVEEKKPIEWPNTERHRHCARTWLETLVFQDVFRLRSCSARYNNPEGSVIIIPKEDRSRMTNCHNGHPDFWLIFLHSSHSRSGLIARFGLGSIC